MIELFVSAFFVATVFQGDAAPAGAQAEATAQQSSPAKPSEPTVTAAPAKPKKICRKLGGTGSRLDTGKVCKTAAEWERFDNEQ